MKMQVTFRNLFLALMDQLPITRFVRNLYKGNFKGLFSPRSHFNGDGRPKIRYSSKVKAEKAAAKMKEKRGAYFSNYKCVFCDGYHIGKNIENRILHNVQMNDAE